MGSKVFKNLEEQIEILKNKGLTVVNSAYAREILLKENYFFLNGYRHPFLKSTDYKVFIKGATFEEIYNLFLFDRELRNLMFKNILIIENNIKSIMSYFLSKKYGYKEKDYLNPQNFNNTPEKRKQITDLLTKMKRQIKTNTSQHTATMHYLNNYGYIPLWVLVKVLSFGIMSELFSILKKEEQLDIVEHYNLDIDNFSNYLSILSNYRNLCAHEDILYDNKTKKMLGDTKYHRLLKIPIMDNEFIYGKNDLFAMIIILKFLLSKEEFSDLIEKLEFLFNNLEKGLFSVPLSKIMDRMGFPDNYYELENCEEMKHE